MVNLPDTRPEMVAADFDGVKEALKGETTCSFIFMLSPLTDLLCFQNQLNVHIVPAAFMICKFQCFYNFSGAARKDAWCF